MRDPENRIKYSIVTVTHKLFEADRFELVRRMTQSLWSQTERSFEHIFQDGGSDDGTVWLLEELAEEAPGDVRTRIYSKPDHGLYEAMNRGIRHARGDYIIIMNSHDAFASEHALESIENANRDGCLDFIYGNAIMVEPDEETAHVAHASLNDCLHRTSIPHPALAVRNTVCRELGGFDLRYRIAADYDFMLRLINGGYEGRKTDTPISRHRSGGKSSDREACADDCAQIWKRLYSQWIDMSDYDLEDCRQWFFQEKIPRDVIWRLFRSPKVGRAIRRAAWHSLNKSARKDVGRATGLRRRG